MARAPEVGLTLKYRDEASRPLARSMQDVEKNTQRAEKAVIGLSRESQRMASAREQLGVRSERTIQREIQQTEAAYKRLASSGTMTAREQTRAYSSMRDQVKELRREMTGVSQLHRNLAAGSKTLAAVAVGTVAGGAVLSSPMRRVANYDMRLAQMANTAFNDTEENGRKLSVEEQLQRRRDGKKQLQDYIATAGLEGGTNDDNAAALDKLIARGIFSPQQAGKLLPMISKAATASGSSAEEMTDVVMAAVQNAKIPIDQIPKALGMALKAGQLGGFELKDMAKWLPKLLAVGGVAGLRGIDGLSKILSVSQMAVTAAGGTEEAGNNVLNFLQKLTSADTANDFKKISARTFGDKKRGEKGIDLYGTLIQAREKGMDAVDAFTALVSKVAKADPEFAKLEQRVKSSAGDKDKSDMFASMADIMMAKGIGKTVQDRQALLGLLPILFDPAKLAELDKKTKAGGAQDVETNHLFMKEQDSFKFQQKDNAWEQGQYDSIGKLNNVVGDVAGKLAEYGYQYPGLTASLVGATTAVSALAAAAGAAALPMLLMGRGGLPGSRSGGNGPATRATGNAGVALRAGGLGLAALSLANFTTDQEDEELKNGKALWKQIRSRYSQAQIDAARKRYQPWYQFGDGYAAENEQWLKRYSQDEARSKAPPIDLRNAPSSAAPIPQLGLLQSSLNASTGLDMLAQKMQQAANQPVKVQVEEIKVQVGGEFRLSGGDLVATVNGANSRNAQRQ